MSDRRSVGTIAGVVLLVSVVAGAVLVTLLRDGTDPARLLSFLGSMIVPAAVALLAVDRAEKATEQVKAVNETVANVATDVAEVREQTNGALHALVEEVQAANGHPLESAHGAIQEQGQGDHRTGGSGAASGS